MAGPQPIKIAILAMGGEGGGVLADWIVALAEHNGHLAQTTSVPGVAQRTGATLYYVELFPEGGPKAPVLALMPLPGDVDVVLASELMEAGRAVQRGLVTPERTTLIASTHRVYAIAEKVVPGDGRVDSAALLAHAQAAARTLVAFDMADVAEASGSVISAVLFGALAASGVLPFARERFEATIARGSVGVQASLRAFAAGFDAAAHGPVATGDSRPAPAAAATPAWAPAASPAHHPEVARLLERAQREFGGTIPPPVLAGLRRLVDYQDVAYAAQYLDRLAAIRALGSPELTDETARHLAVAMAYEDTLRVAELKTRDTRFARVRAEVGAGEATIVEIAEYLHPRLQEVADTLPARWGRWLLASGAPRRWVERKLASGRTVRTSTLRGYLLLRAVAALTRWRRGTLRFAAEQARIEAWLGDIVRCARTDPALALEVARCQRVVKGYGETHERGLARYAALREAWLRDGADASRLARLREAALRE